MLMWQLTSLWNYSDTNLGRCVALAHLSGFCQIQPEGLVDDLIPSLEGKRSFGCMVIQDEMWWDKMRGPNEQH